MPSNKWFYCYSTRFIVSLASGLMIGCATPCNEGSVELAESQRRYERLDNDPTLCNRNENDDKETRLTIICDIPSELRRNPVIYSGYVYWANSALRQDVIIQVGRTSFDLIVDGDIASNEPISVYFRVPKDPSYATRFKKGQWVYRGIPTPNFGDVESLAIKLSEFRWEMFDEAVQSMAPG
ncbi:MAG: hypothetical protein FLDDKLPJ_03717 [Phycisphaerae bacterium]|nr:hypothetical protein [Phycisphaerae bacterium]